jgi:methylenetetrahydrofolate dehydrogenase (NADP+)/methenyltetrahydrofolate cyclohydrolase
MVLLEGLKIANQIKEEIAETVTKMKEAGQKVPHLAAVLVGEDGASLTYVGSKVRSCQKIGFESTLIKLPQEVTEEVLLKHIDELNRNPEIDGFIVQLPLPKHIDEHKIIMAIDPAKDVDGFHPVNVGKMCLDLETFLPATPYGVMELLERYQISVSGKHAVVIGRSHIVGRPMSVLLSRKGIWADATVTLAHSRTKNLKELLLQADVVVSALGVPHFVKGDMIKEGAVVVDVGIHRIPDARLPKGYYITGDVDFDAVSKKASYITPVPGGVGAMTIAMLLKNTLIARERAMLMA